MPEHAGSLAPKIDAPSRRWRQNTRSVISNGSSDDTKPCSRASCRPRNSSILRPSSSTASQIRTSSSRCARPGRRPRTGTFIGGGLVVTVMLHRCGSPRANVVLATCGKLVASLVASPFRRGAGRPLPRKSGLAWPRARARVPCIPGCAGDTVTRVGRHHTAGIPAAVPLVIPTWKGKAALREAGLPDAIETAVAASGDRVQDAWAGASEWSRDSDFLVSLAAGLGLTEQQVDGMFRSAGAIQS